MQRGPDRPRVGVNPQSDRCAGRAVPLGITKHVRDDVFERMLVGTYHQRLPMRLVLDPLDPHVARVGSDVTQESVQVHWLQRQMGRFERLAG